jgi:GNAT superfamily N-acetyltransferase
MIRAARKDDAPGLVRLLEELGYPSSAEAIGSRMDSLADDPDTWTFVAEARGELVGLASMRLLRVLHADEAIAMVTALVVRSDARGSGVGRQLVVELEGIARSRGCTRMILTSGSHRSDAHRFYERVGFSATGLRFMKEL